MTQIAAPANFIGQRVEAIPGTPLPHGLLNVATILDVTDTHELNGVQWQPLSCAQAQTTFWCPPEGDDPPDEKTFTNSGTSYAPPVAVYYGRECPPIGEEYDYAVTYVKAGLAAGEQVALERWLWDNILQPEADDVTTVPGTPVSIQVGIGLIEAALGDVYGGIGVLHVPLVAGAPVASDGHIVAKGAQITSWTGHLVSLGAGYSNTSPGNTPTPAAAGRAWLYASGPVIVRREPVEVIPPSDREAINIVLNDRDLIAERTWVIGVECAVKAVLVDLTT